MASRCSPGIGVLLCAGLLLTFAACVHAVSSTRLSNPVVERDERCNFCVLLVPTCVLVSACRSWLHAVEFEAGLHALSIVARSPSQWEHDQSVSKSPPCLGGSKKS